MAPVQGIQASSIRPAQSASGYPTQPGICNPRIYVYVLSRLVSLFCMTPFDVSVRFFIQLAVVLAACRVVGRVARRLGQPQVVAEMLTGVLLGPSVLGLFEATRPFQQWLFPPESKVVFLSVSQVGLALYMFLVGSSSAPISSWAGPGLRHWSRGRGWWFRSSSGPAWRHC